jgi:hypothetical protein
VLNHPALYPASTLAWAKQHRASEHEPEVVETPSRRCLRIVYLIHNIRGVTGGNLTLLAQANALVDRGHHVSIVTYSEPPDWMPVRARVIRVPSRVSMASAAPEADVVIATYFLNAVELPAIDAPVKLYFAQGDQFVFTQPPTGSASSEPEPSPPAKMSKLYALRNRVHRLRDLAHLHQCLEDRLHHWGQVCGPSIFHPLMEKRRTMPDPHCGP